ncbi:MAG: ABC transporter ATP-binding protein [Alphaproteobacteria bacterium]|uniref:ABC transporter ATP-binding protein n=1 Tax=Pacificispira sp. TaxID=2888761 RepID=UPI00296977B7|nr:ABC transporter ATP-binding protein [Alphaproteobacteria bacterium]
MTSVQLLNDMHLAGHSLTALLGNDYHWSIHLVTHFIMFGLPAALLAVAGIPGIVAIGRIFRRQQRRHLFKRVQNPFSLERPLLAFILSSTKGPQIALIVWAAASLPILYLTLELPKLIINNAIESGHFPVEYFGISVDQITLLALLCAAFLAVVALNGFLKYQVNVKAGRVSEIFARRLRLLTYRIWQRGPGRGHGADFIPVAAQEVEPIGGFAGEALVLPVFQGGTFLTIIFFMLMQDPILGGAALALLPVQILIVPRLQARINELARERVREVRRFGALVSDVTHSEDKRQEALFRSFRQLQSIRFRIHERKFFMKSLNNFIGQLTPFFFYTIGGVLVIEGRLSLGALVAVLTAYKDLASPVKELFRYYQASADVHVRYEEIQSFLKIRTRT